MDIVIVGVGVIGVELLVELYNVVKELCIYGFGDFDLSKLNVNLIEVGECILLVLLLCILVVVY